MHSGTLELSQKVRLFRKNKTKTESLLGYHVHLEGRLTLGNLIYDNLSLSLNQTGSSVTSDYQAFQ